MSVKTAKGNTSVSEYQSHPPKLIAQKSKELSELVLELEADNREYTAATLVEKAVKPKVKTTVGSLMKDHIKELREAKRIGYALSMEQVYNSLIKFNEHLDMPFSDIDQGLFRYTMLIYQKKLDLEHNSH